MFLLKCFSNKRRNTVKLSVSYRWTRLHYSLFSNWVKCYLSIILLSNTPCTLVFFQQHQHQRTKHFACNTVHLLQCKTSFLLQLWPYQPRYELKCFQHKIYGVTRHHEYEMQVKNIEEILKEILKKSSSKWMNSGKPSTQHLKGAIFAFPCSPGGAETLVRWGGKTKHRSIASSLSNRPISAKNYQNRLMCVEVIVYSVQHRCCFLTQSVVDSALERYASSGKCPRLLLSKRARPV